MLRRLIRRLNIRDRLFMRRNDWPRWTNDANDRMRRQMPDAS